MEGNEDAYDSSLKIAPDFDFCYKQNKLDSDKAIIDCLPPRTYLSREQCDKMNSYDESANENTRE